MGDLGPAELRRMQELAQRVTAVRPELLNGDATVGELAWCWGKDFDTRRQFWRHRFWTVDDRLVGWGWATLPGAGKAAGLVWQTDPERPELLTEILDWYDEVAADVDRTLTIQSADTAAQAVTARHGYALDTADESWVQWNTRELTDLPEPVLPAGFRFLAAQDVSVAEAFQAHRAAWPSSRLTEAALERVQRTWPYRADLHVLIQAPDGTLAASAIAWLDEATRTAEFEPVGTHQDFRRLGLATALQLHGMRRARAAGATRMFVACLGSPNHPAARAMYYGVGFRPITRDLPQIKCSVRAASRTAP